MQREVRYRRHPDEQDALLLAWVLILGVLGIGYFIVWDRLHVRADQLIEMTIYPLLFLVYLWEVLRYRATRISKMETAWPRPIPRVIRRQDENYLEEARGRSSVLLGYDIFGEPFYWSDKTRTMQSNAFGMTGAGKPTCLNLTERGHRSRRAHHLHRRQRRQEAAFRTASIDRGRRADAGSSHHRSHAAGHLGALQPILGTAGQRGRARCPSSSSPSTWKKDFFEGHQRVYLENIARVLHYSGKRFNFHDVLVCAYDQAILKSR